MRADRLISLLLLLQSRGRLSAGELSKELEVSTRTIYRDIDALNIAGIPVYGEPGPDGGYSLLENYRTRLTGLSDKELRALFMLDIPEPLMKLGIGQELKTALLKLSAELHRDRLVDEMKVRNRIHLDSTWWQHDEESIPHLRTIYSAVLEDRKINIRYKLPFPGVIELQVDPYGLVAKAGVWYLVYSVYGNIRTGRVLSFLDVSVSGESFDRPADFDIAVYWEKWCSEREKTLVSYAATVRVAPDFIPVLYRYFGENIKKRIENTLPDSQGRLTVELHFESLQAARERILGFGRGVEVLEPQALRRSVLDFAEQTVSLYAADKK